MNFFLYRPCLKQWEPITYEAYLRHLAAMDVIPKAWSGYKLVEMAA